MQDAEAIEEEERQYGHGPLTDEELNEKCGAHHSSMRLCTAHIS